MNKVFISTEKINNNINIIKNSISNSCKIIAVVKGDAYGHGILDVSKVLQNNQDVCILAAATLEEALLLIEGGIDKEILILNHTPSEHIKRKLSKYTKKRINTILSKIMFSVYSLDCIEDLNKLSEEMGEILKLHIRLDFHGACKGLSRNDFTLFMDYYQENQKHVKIKGIYAHVYSTYGEDRHKASNDLKEYAEVFRTIPNNIRNSMMIHLLTSLSFSEFPEYCFDAVRIGAAIYGMPVTSDHYKSPLIPVMSVRGKVLSIHDIDTSSEFDYGGLIHCGPRKVAFISIGAWDAPNFFRGNVTTVNICGSCYRSVGKPCMDSFCVDISDSRNVHVNDDVWLLADLNGVNLFDKIEENNYLIDDCQMLFSGMGRIERVIL